MDKTLLQQEYDKACRRLAEQGKVLNDTQIAASQTQLPSLAATAKRRLPKLREVHDQTLALVSELSKALGFDQVQTDIETILAKSDTSPASAKKR